MDNATKHGTYTCYLKGCRRPECKEAWATYIRERRHRLGLQKPREDFRFYEGPYEAAPQPRLTPMGMRILDAVVEREGKRASDVFEKLLRDYGSEVTFEGTA